MTINGSTFNSQTTLFLRSVLASGVTDPISGQRSGSEAFVMTSYPERNVRYPIITIKSNGPKDILRGGMQSTDMYMNLPFEIRIWARNQREKDTLAEQCYSFLRLNQFSGAYSTINMQLFGFMCTSMVDVDETDKPGIKSKILTVEYKLVAI